MSQKEVARLGVIKQVLDEGLCQADAAQLLGLSIRQVKRLCRRVREQGARGLISRRRGQPSHRRIAGGERDHNMALVREHYADFGPGARVFAARARFCLERGDAAWLDDPGRAVAVQAAPV